MFTVNHATIQDTPTIHRIPVLDREVIQMVGFKNDIVNNSNVLFSLQYMLSKETIEALRKPTFDVWLWEPNEVMLQYLNKFPTSHSVYAVLCKKA